MKKPVFRRILAYLVDSILIVAIVSIFSNIDLINPYKEEYENTYKEYQEYVLKFSDSNNPEMVMGEEYNDLIYDIAHNGLYVSIISLIVTFLYFCIFQFYNGGKTIGKALLNIKIVSTNNEKLNIYQFIIRSGIINSLLTSSATIITLLALSKPSFLTVNSVIGFIDMGLIFTSIGMILFREDGVGLHDLLAHTLVVDANYKEETEESEEKPKTSKKKVTNKVREAKYEEKSSKRKTKKESEK